MELPCLPLKSMLEPPKLLRRPLPPKILPVIKRRSPSPRQRGSTPSYEQQQIQEMCVLNEEHNRSKVLEATSTVENTNPPSEGMYIKGKLSFCQVFGVLPTCFPFLEQWIYDQRAPTPAASRLNSDDFPPHWSSLVALNHIQSQHKYPITEQTQHGELMHRGHSDLPLKRRYKHPLTSDNEDTQRHLPAPEFTFNDFIARSAYQTGSVKELLSKPLISSEHYNTIEDNIVKLQQKIQDKVHKVLLSPSNIPKVSQRIPLQQLALEKQQETMKKAAEIMGTIGEDAVHPLYSSQLMKNGKSLYQEQSKIVETYCDLAILESLVNGGHALSLKAYFISKLPDLKPLYTTLLRLNLSFNEFWQFPSEVYRLQLLEFLTLRNNPIKEIAYGIHSLKNLRTLIVSFCSLSSLPEGLFLLPYLQLLDVSYNNIKSIPNEIANVRALEFLNVEGNSLPALPCGALKLKLKQLRVSNNRMHPLFWRENSHIQPQKLLDLAVMSFVRNNLFHHFPDISSQAKETLVKVKVCDCCRGVLSGEGLRFIRPCEKIFGIRKLPFMFHSCSPSCYRNFMSQTESLSQYLYET
ncbi:leucine-rich repeat-containing protein 63 [Gastrophryne carolinensis]